ncbi:MAG: HD domain-containing protein [Synergistota bacterium]|nr:HD domain-containing protein [Synergistota bacterium]
MLDMVDLIKLEKNPKVRAYIQAADDFLSALGYTEHGFRHAAFVAKVARNILVKLDYGERMAELAAIAGYLHDIGNICGREMHGPAGALIAFRLLEEIGMDPSEIGKIMVAISNHEEEIGIPVDPITAALILADKSDVHYSRVRNPDIISFDIHDRVNYAVRRSFLNVDKDSRKITLEIEIDTEISQVMEYFEIFLTRMLISRKAAHILGCEFGLVINGVKLL